MAVRAHKKIQNALLMAFKPGGAIGAGRRVKFGADDDTVLEAGAGEDGVGVTLDAAAGASSDRITIVMDGQAVVPVKVGTGGATRGGYADNAADGLKDRAIADGTNPRFLAGKFLQSGVVGDVVGLMIGVPTPTATA